VIAWKDFDLATTDRLRRKGLIGDPVNKSKSLVLTDEGLKRSEALFRKQCAIVRGLGRLAHAGLDDASTQAKNRQRSSTAFTGDTQPSAHQDSHAPITCTPVYRGNMDCLHPFSLDPTRPRLDRRLPDPYLDTIRA
jgi:Domain of unknown function (DUF6429)